MTEPAPGRCPPAWRARAAGRCGESHGPLSLPGYPRCALPLSLTTGHPQLSPFTAATVHSCTSPSNWPPWSVSHLSWVGSGRHSCCRSPPLQRRPPRPRPRSCGARPPTPTRHLHTCPEAPGWAMHTAGTHSRLAKPPLFKHHGTRSNPDKSSRPYSPPQDEQDWGGWGQGEGHRPERLSIWDRPNSGLFPENLIFTSFFFFGKKMTF